MNKVTITAGSQRVVCSDDGTTRHERSGRHQGHDYWFFDHNKPSRELLAAAKTVHKLFREAATAK